MIVVRSMVLTAVDCIAINVLLLSDGAPLPVLLPVLLDRLDPPLLPVPTPVEDRDDEKNDDAAATADDDDDKRNDDDDEDENDDDDDDDDDETGQLVGQASDVDAMPLTRWSTAL
jgi:hypothetical protein